MRITRGPIKPMTDEEYKRHLAENFPDGYTQAMPDIFRVSTLEEMGSGDGSGTRTCRGDRLIGEEEVDAL